MLTIHNITKLIGKRFSTKLNPVERWMVFSVNEYMDHYSIAIIADNDKSLTFDIQRNKDNGSMAYNVITMCENKDVDWNKLTTIDICSVDNILHSLKELTHYFNAIK